MNLYQNQYVLVIGMGISGKSAARFLLERGAKVLGVDKKRELISQDEALKSLCSQGMTLAHETDSISVDAFDFVVVSPGVPQSNPLYLEALAKNKEIVGEVELACRGLNQPFLGITGTNGKTTVTLLTAHVLNFCQKQAVALGNVGVPITSELGPSSLGKIIVAELSSFQLETLKSKVIDAGVILNITPDHLDRYQTMDNYAKAKFLMKNCLRPDGELYVDEKAMWDFGSLAEGYPIKTYGYSSKCDLFSDKARVFFQQNLEFILPLSYRGVVSHDVENLLASYALCRRMGVSGDKFIKALQTFKKPPHRIEFVDSVNGIDYYDDSKGTNIDAVIRAVQSLSGKMILIAGGVDKGSSYLPWISAFQGKVSSICAIGQAAEKIKIELSSKLKVDIYSSLEHAVHAATRVAQQGDTVLLSPGCSSYDMFRDYAHRGNEFKKIVHELKGRRT